MKTLIYFVISILYLSVAGAQHPAGIIWANPNGDARYSRYPITSALVSLYKVATPEQSQYKCHYYLATILNLTMG